MFDIPDFVKEIFKESILKLDKKLEQAFRSFFGVGSGPRYYRRGKWTLAIGLMVLFGWIFSSNITSAIGLVTGMLNRRLGNDIPIVSGEKFSILVSDFDKDANGEAKTLITAALSKIQSIEVIQVDRTLAERNGSVSAKFQENQKEALELLNQSHANFIVWGTATKLGSKIHLWLHLSSSNTIFPGNKGKTYSLDPESGIEPAFFNDLLSEIGLHYEHGVSPRKNAHLSEESASTWQKAKYVFSERFGSADNRTQGHYKIKFSTDSYMLWMNSDSKPLFDSAREILESLTEQDVASLDVDDQQEYFWTSALILGRRIEQGEDIDIVRVRAAFDGAIVSQRCLQDEMKENKIGLLEDYGNVMRSIGEKRKDVKLLEEALKILKQCLDLQVLKIGDERWTRTLKAIGITSAILARLTGDKEMCLYAKRMIDDSIAGASASLSGAARNDIANVYAICGIVLEDLNLLDTARDHIREGIKELDDNSAFKRSMMQTNLASITSQIAIRRQSSGLVCQSLMLWRLVIASRLSEGNESAIDMPLAALGALLKRPLASPSLQECLSSSHEGISEGMKKYFLGRVLTEVGLTFSDVSSLCDGIGALLQASKNLDADQVSTSGVNEFLSRSVYDLQTKFHPDRAIDCINRYSKDYPEIFLKGMMRDFNFLYTFPEWPDPNPKKRAKSKKPIKNSENFRSW